MEIRLTKELLQKSVQTVQNAVSQKSGLPILANILFEAFKDKASFIATDLEIGIISRTKDVKVQEEGAISIPAKKISDIVKELPNEEVCLLSKKNNQVVIKCGKSVFKIMGLPKDEFPKIPEMGDKEALFFPQKVLKNMLNMTSFAVSRDETRYILNGILFIVANKKLRLISTDGRRLSMVEKETQKQINLSKKVIIPLKATSELLKILKDEGEVKILFSENQIAFEFDETLLITRLIEGEYPNYEQVIPKPSQEKMKVAKESFYSAVKRANLFTSADSQSIKLDLLNNKLVISKTSQDGSESREELDCGYSGDGLSIGFNPAYLLDVLKNVDEEEVVMEFAGADKRGVIRSNNGDYIYIVLPVRME